MSDIKIEDIEAAFEDILSQVGEESYVNWDAFTKSSTTLSRHIDELAKALAIYKQIQQKRFITTMKKLKGTDVPDLIKTVKNKKLPREALRSILPRFKLNGEKLEFTEPVENLKVESQKIFSEYISTNETLAEKIRETKDLVEVHIKESGLYEEPPVPKVLVSTFKHSFDEGKLESARKAVQVQYLPGTVDTIHIKTYAQVVENTFQLVKQEYKRLTVENRIRQRAIKDNKLYIGALIQYLTNTEVLIQEGQKAIVGRLGISAQKWQESEIALLEKGLAQNIMIIQSTLRSRVKESIVGTQGVSIEKAKEILRFQVNLLKGRVEYFREIFDSLEKTEENYQLIPMLLALTLNDIVFENFKLEEEDFMKNLGENVIISNQEVMNIFKEMELAIIQLMQQLGIINEQIGNYMQGQTQGLGQALTPGSNPVDLLQQQQTQLLQYLQSQQQEKK